MKSVKPENGRMGLRWSVPVKWWHYNGEQKMRTASLINRDAVQSPVRYNLCSTTYYRRKLPIIRWYKTEKRPSNFFQGLANRDANGTMKNMLISAITGWYEMDFEHVKKSARERIFWYFLSIRNIASGKLLSGRSGVRVTSRTRIGRGWKAPVLSCFWDFWVV